MWGFFARTILICSINISCRKNVAQTFFAQMRIHFLVYAKTFAETLPETLRRNFTSTLDFWAFLTIMKFQSLRFKNIPIIP